LFLVTGFWLLLLGDYMFCNFCGKNFEASEGFEETNRHGHHLVRCDKCVYTQREEEYDWRAEMYGRGHPLF